MGQLEQLTDKKFAILFDMDGVLVDSNPFHKIALRKFCLSHGYSLSENDLRQKIYGRANKDWIPNLFGSLSPEKLKTYADEKEALFRSIYEKDIKPVKGLIPFLDKVEFHRIPHAIATSAPIENVRFTLNKTGLGKYFTIILDESFVSRGKPNPEIYIKAAKAVGFEPHQCFVIEDSLAGIASGKAAGAKVIAITTTHPAEELKEADLIISDFDQLSLETLIPMI